eukprot:CAMPEP_0117653784 /NCGR_PEP_ID=MMETSP0804-20121206/3385_1 /TAXON_ID=1074897 /ORGANISM="Tetraselmis astigmatica, Strain CCMP880" /LENGTH=49 /DNA_ID= /DNA_START= /DNA_END= /DNA_ORIENTATION=
MSSTQSAAGAVLLRLQELTKGVSTKPVLDASARTPSASRIPRNDPASHR